MSGCCCWISSTIAPIGSSTSGVQTSASAAISGRIGRLSPGPPGQLSRDPEHQHAQQPPQDVFRERLSDLHAGLDPCDRAEREDEGGAPADVPVPALLPPTGGWRWGG